MNYELLTSAELNNIRQRWERAQPAPWGWTGHKESKSFSLTRLVGWGETVMTFRRWGFQGAMPVFDVDRLLRPATDFMIIPQPHHPWEIRGIDHPDAIAIEWSPSDINSLLAHIDALEAELAAVRQAVAS